MYLTVYRDSFQTELFNILFHGVIILVFQRTN